MPTDPDAVINSIHAEGYFSPDVADQQSRKRKLSNEDQASTDQWPLVLRAVLEVAIIHLLTIILLLLLTYTLSIYIGLI